MFTKRRSTGHSQGMAVRISYLSITVLSTTRLLIDPHRLPLFRPQLLNNITLKLQLWEMSLIKDQSLKEIHKID